LDRIISLLIVAVPLLFAIVIHEVAHGWMASKFGDLTAKQAGRLTLNPLPHIDPLGTIIVPLLLYFSNAGFLFGWAKPVPINPYYMRHPKDDIIWVSFAGPGANLLTALACGFVIRIIRPVSHYLMSGSSFIIPFAHMLVYGMIINLVLAFFNLIPLPPLDGSKILAGFLPPRYEYKMEQLERFGPFLLFGIILVASFAGIPILSWILNPFVSFFSYLFAGPGFSRFF
jgi:Zn-dependent protease